MFIRNCNCCYLYCYCLDCLDALNLLCRCFWCCFCSLLQLAENLQCAIAIAIASVRICIGAGAAAADDDWEWKWYKIALLESERANVFSCVRVCLCAFCNVLPAGQIEAE